VGVVKVVIQTREEGVPQFSIANASSNRLMAEPTRGANAIPHAALEYDLYRSVTGTSSGSRPAPESKAGKEPDNSTDSDAWSDAEDGEESEGPRVGQKYQAAIPTLRSCAGA